MADNWMCLFPEEPLSPLPAPEALQSAQSRIAEMLPITDGIEILADAMPFQIHGGANWDGVSCPACGADLETWWDDVMSGWVEGDRSSLAVVTPCCSCQTTLDKLNYGWPFGFGRFSIEIRNPQRELSADELGDLGRLLGVKLRFLWQRI